MMDETAGLTRRTSDQLSVLAMVDVSYHMYILLYVLWAYARHTGLLCAAAEEGETAA